MSVKRFIPWILFISVFIPLLLTSYPSIGWWNSGGYASCAFGLGIPEPGGSILFVLMGKLFVNLFFFISPIKAIILVSIISTAIAAVFLYYSLLAILDSINLQVPEKIRIATSFFTSLSLPFLYSIWIESISVQVYSLGLLITSILVYSAGKIWFSEDEKEKTRFIFLIAFLIGLDFTAHRLNTPFIPVFVILLFFSLRNQFKKISFWFGLIGLYILGLSFNLFLLIRSPMDPVYAMDNVQNIGALMDWINMKRFGESNLSIIFNRRASFWDYQVNHMYLRYFGWNFLGLQGEGTIFNHIYFSFIPFLLGVVGFVFSLIKRFKVWILIFISFFFFSFGLIIYSNTRQGFDTIREIDRLFIPSFYVFLFFIGIGLYLVSYLLYNVSLKLKLTKFLIIIVFSLLSFIILPFNIYFTNLPKCNKSGYYFPADFAYNMLIGCERNAILFTNGDNDSYPLWYLQVVEGIRTDIAVINLPLLNTDYYCRQLQKKFKLFPENSEIFNPGKFRPSLIDSAVSIKLSGKDSSNSAGNTNLKTYYEGRDFGKKKGLLPQDKALISLLEKNGWKRPVYFASTVSEDNILGLSEYLSIAGMNRKLFPVKRDSVIWLKLKENLMEKYRYRNFNNSAVYSDRTTIMLFNNYRYLYVLLARYYFDQGDKTKARQIIDNMELYLPSWRFDESQNNDILNFERLLKE